jgi:hypothetical protein
MQFGTANEAKLLNSKRTQALHARRVINVLVM